MSRTVILVSTRGDRPNRYHTNRLPLWAFRFWLRLTGWEARPLVTFRARPTPEQSEPTPEEPA